MSQKEIEKSDFRTKRELDIRVPYQLSYWAKELNVSGETLKLAWYEVGPDIDKIKVHLKGK